MLLLLALLTTLLSIPLQKDTFEIIIFHAHSILVLMQGEPIILKNLYLELIIRVDSCLLDGYISSQFAHPQLHSPVNTTFSQLFRFLNQLSRCPVHATFMFDGEERPSYKRGVKVISRSPLLYQQAQILIQAFGFNCYVVSTYCISRRDISLFWAYFNRLKATQRSSFVMRKDWEQSTLSLPEIVMYLHLAQNVSSE